MKNLLKITALVLSLAACTEAKKVETTTKSDSLKVEVEMAQAAYACPMDKDITGKKGDKCSKCGMELEVIAKK